MISSGTEVVTGQVDIPANLSAKTVTADEYLASEVESLIRHEYRNGEIIEMTGGTPTHNELVRSMIVLLSLALRGKPLQIFVTDQRLWIPDRQVHTYPDVMVVAKPIALLEGRKDTVTEPIFIAEVLSPSTKNYDRGEKFSDYRTIPSFQEYLLIEQSKIHVEHYVRQGVNQWLLREYAALGDRWSLSSLDIELSLADLYENVEF
jgi:Uma2 family endonuclease